MTIKNFLELRGWSCDWLDVKSGTKEKVTIYNAWKKGYWRNAVSLTVLKKKCIKADKLIKLETK